MKRCLVLVASLCLSAPLRAAKVVAPESVTAPVAPSAPVLPVLAPSILSPRLTPSLSAAPLPAAPLAAAPAMAVAAVPAATPALSVPAPVSARAAVEHAATALSVPGADIAGDLGRVYDSSSLSPALAAEVAAPAEGPARRRASGLSKASAPAPKAVRREFKSPQGAEARELQRLSVSLEENFLPPVQAKVVTEVVDANRPTVVILSPASRHKVAIAREGGRQSPGDVHLALDASWLIQEEGPDGRTRLLLKKGVTFDEKGQATIVEYRVPRVVRYFADYFTLGANDRDDGVVFERNLDLPQSNSLKLEAFVNDKLQTRLELGAAGVGVPATLAFLMPKHVLAERAGSLRDTGEVSVAAMPQGALQSAEVERQVHAFLDRYQGTEIVVKPSGAQYHSGRGVKFFRKEQRAQIVAHVLALSRDPMMTQDGAVLVDARVMSAPLMRDGRKMETTMRVLVARTPSGGAKTMDVFARVGPWGKPTTAEAADPRDNARVEPVERLMKEWGLSGARAKAFRARLDRMGEDALKAIMAREKTFARAPGEPYQDQTDLIGLDVMVEDRGSELVPMVIEVNDHDSGGQFNMDAQIATDRIGRHSREWVATMLQRARRDALRGKRIVIVGAGYEGKRFIFEKAKELGVQVVLVDKAATFARGLVSEVIASDNSKPEEALAKARKKLLASARKNGKIDGLTTFWEDDVPLAAGLAESLGVPYHTRAAAQAVRSKAQTRDVLEKAGVPTPRHRRVTNLNTAKSDAERARILDEFRSAADFVGYPAVIKPAFGAAAMGVKRVDSREQALAAFAEMARMVTPQTDPIFKQGTDLVLEQYLDGPEWDVDLVMQGGQAVFASLTDNKPTREPYFLATGSRLPSELPADHQKQSMALSIRAAQALGLTDGVIHMEGKYTSQGARLIEGNGRMGGEYVRDWVRDVWGVDLVEENLMAAAGIPVKPFMPEAPLVHLDGDFIIPAESGVITSFSLPEDARKSAGFHELRTKKGVGDSIAVPPDGYERAGMLVARGATRAEAAGNLKALKAKLRLVIKRRP